MLDPYELRDFWNKTANKFGKNGYRAVLFPSSRGILNWYIDYLQRKALSKNLSELKGKRVLDIGCGVGRWSIELAVVADYVIGFDFSREMVIIAKSRVIEEMVDNVDFVVASVHSLPFLSQSFDASLSVTVLSHIVDDKQLGEAISEITKIMKSNRRIILMEQTPHSKEVVHSQFPTVGRTKEAWVSFFAQAHAKLIALHGVDLSPFVRPFLWVLKKHGRYRNWLSQNTPSLKYRILSGLFYHLLSLGVILSLPFDLAFRDVLMEYSNYKLLIFEKSVDKNQEV
jgi:ubiquinone/menaquinone biosynthesis C-methylase UbiE